MAAPSLQALIDDLCPDAATRVRLPLAEALARCRRDQVMAASDAGADVVVVVTRAGQPFVAPDFCPHDGGLLSDGFLDGDRLVCARHGWEFDLGDGACAGQPERRLACQELARPRDS